MVSCTVYCVNYVCTCLGVGVGEGDVTGCEVGVWLRRDQGALQSAGCTQSGHSGGLAYRSPQYSSPPPTFHREGRRGGGRIHSNILNTFQLSQSSGGNKPSINPKSSRWLRKSVKALFYTCKLKKIYPTNMIYMESVWVQCINKFHCIMCVSVQQCTAMYNSLTMSE